MGRALGCGARSRARKFEATTYLKTEHPEEIPAQERQPRARLRLIMPADREETAEQRFLSCAGRAGLMLWDGLPAFLSVIAALLCTVAAARSEKL